MDSDRAEFFARQVYQALARFDARLIVDRENCYLGAQDVYVKIQLNRLDFSLSDTLPDNFFARRYLDFGSIKVDTISGLDLESQLAARYFDQLDSLLAQMQASIEFSNLPVDALAGEFRRKYDDIEEITRRFNFVLTAKCRGYASLTDHSFKLCDLFSDSSIAQLSAACNRAFPQGRVKFREWL